MSSHLKIVQITHVRKRDLNPCTSRWELIPDRRTLLLSMSHKAVPIYDNPKRHVRSSEMSSHLKIVQITHVRKRDLNPCTSRWELIPDRRTLLLSMSHKAATNTRQLKSDMFVHRKCPPTKRSQKIQARESNANSPTGVDPRTRHRCCLTTIYEISYCLTTDGRTHEPDAACRK